MINLFLNYNANTETIATPAVLKMIYNANLQIRGEFDMSKTPKKVTFTDAKIGDRVWSLTEGWGTVTSRFRSYTEYPLTVKFENGETKTYTLWGRFRVKDLNPTLFWNEVGFDTPEKSLPQLEVDTKVVVWDQVGRKYKRHFSHFDGKGRMCAFNHGHTSFSCELNPEVWVTAWDHWELAE